ncbi:hypothetical protein QCD61_28375 (plasmid) [Pseudomonas viciae]|uniref:Uncharacterized protein n=1 Tax=Pseudomonas viciae TaxID=2505979 RepID=A0ABY8PMS3_9PSED|nr:hypothetical protein [Pseudomonas viciae]WGO96416.1 hypothetical protein QCD61_28375 [Pseudomonas viciae]
MNHNCHGEFFTVSGARQYRCSADSSITSSAVRNGDSCPSCGRTIVAVSEGVQKSTKDTSAPSTGALGLSVARRRLKAPGYLETGALLVGVAAIYLYLFQPFWPASRASALFSLAAVVFLMAIAMRKKALVVRALLCGVPAAIAAGAWLFWVSSLPANTEAPLKDVEPLFADPQTRSDVLSAFMDNRAFALSVEQLERIRARTYLKYLDKYLEPFAMPPTRPEPPEVREKFIAAMCEAKDFSTSRICTDRKYKRDLATISIEQFAGAKRAQKVESVKTTFNQDGTLTVGALLTYEDGQQENCNFVMVAELAKQNGGKGLKIDPKSRLCTPVAKTN